MKKLLLLLLLIPCSLSLKAQSWNWISTSVPGDTPADHVVATDDSGNAYLVSQAFDTSYITYLIKFDKQGNQKWLQRLVGNVHSATGFVAVATTSGFVYALGDFGNTFVINNDTFNSPHNSSYFLVKYNSAGAVQWVRVSQAINSGRAFAESICSDKWGNAYVTGSTYDTAIIGTDTIFKPEGGGTMFLSKYDSNGNVIWVKTPSATAYSCAGYSVTADIKGNVFVTGGCEDTVVFGHDTLAAASIALRMFIAKYDSGGNIQWARASAGNCSAKGYSVAADGAGNAYVAVNYQYGNYIILGNDTFQSLSYSQLAPLLVKYTPAGAYSWIIPEGYVGSGLQWYFESVAADTSKNVYLLALGSNIGDNCKFEIKQDTFSLSLTVNDPNPTAIVKVDSSGKILCGEIFCEGLEDDGDGLAVSSSGKYIYVGGEFYGRAFMGADTVNAPSNTETLFVASWQPCDSVPLILNNPVMLQNKVTLYPNPNNGAFTLQIKSEQLKMNSVVEIYNMLGERVYTASLELRSSPSGISEGGTSKTLISLSFGEGRGEAGIYLYRIIDANGNQTATGKFVIE